MTTNAQGQTVLQGDGTWPFTVTVDNEDLVLHDENIVTGAQDAIVIATFFGGSASQDPDDNGQTASGLSTRDDPGLIGCALPMSNAGSSATQGSPVPKMPYRDTEIEVCNLENGKMLPCPIVDLGPSKSATSRPNQIHGIDLTRAAFIELGGDLDKGWMHVAWRARAAAHYAGV